MLVRIESLINRLKRLFSRTEWVIRLLGLEKTTDDPGPGLLMIQIDGLSQEQFRQAMDSGKLPFLKTLLERESYRNVSLYSGIPSTTPAVQGELFYGVENAVPAFCWYDRQSGKMQRMFDPDAAAKAAAEMKAQGHPLLLEGGSSYCNIYSGGAARTNFTFESMKVPDFTAFLKVPALMLVGLLHVFLVARVAFFLVVELLMASFDFLKGILKHNSFLKELKFVFARVGITVLTRELVRFHVKTDLACGLRTIHANFVAFDEHAHRRGPHSSFAHWTLKGINSAVKDLYLSAVHSRARDYRVIVFSDHGQEAVTSFEQFSDASIGISLKRLFHDKGLIENSEEEETSEHYSYHRILHYLRVQTQEWSEMRFGGIQTPELVVGAMGPLGHVYYLPRQLRSAEKTDLADTMVEKNGIPMVLFVDEGKVKVRTEKGLFGLPESGSDVLPSDHPFPARTLQDTIRMVRSDKAGDFVICGWRQENAVSFPRENGSHGGIGPEETHGFILMPHEIPTGKKEKSGLRPWDLRQAAFSILGKPGDWETEALPVEEKKGLRVVTYNVHSCFGSDGRTDPERIASILKKVEPDVIALQELEEDTRKSGKSSQIARIADQMGLEYLYLPLIKRNSGQYGIGLLSRFPIRVREKTPYPRRVTRIPKETRGYIWVELRQTPVGNVQLLNTHLGLSRSERLLQVRHLMRDSGLRSNGNQDPVIVVGDLNCGPTTRAYREFIHHGFRDAQEDAEDPVANTFFARAPVARIDHVLYSGPLRIGRTRVLRNTRTRVASDHLPLVADFLPGDGSRS